MTTELKSNVALGLLVVVVALLYMSVPASSPLGSALPGIASRVATSTPAQAVTAATAELIFATTTDCASRVIGTRQGELRLTFSDINGDRPTGQSGFAQLASTTVVYDAGLYGCGAVWAYPYITETISLIETR